MSCGRATADVGLPQPPASTCSRPHARAARTAKRRAAPHPACARAARAQAPSASLSGRTWWWAASFGRAIARYPTKPDPVKVAPERDSSHSPHMKIAITCHYQKLRTGKTRISPAKGPPCPHKNRNSVPHRSTLAAVRPIGPRHSTPLFPPPACHLGSPAQHAPTPPARRTDARPPRRRHAPAPPACRPGACRLGPPAHQPGPSAARRGARPSPPAPTSFYSSRRRRACGCRRRCPCARLS